MVKDIIIILVVASILGWSDYTNFLTGCGLEMSNINWDFLNVLVVIILYIITYKALDRKSIQREKNKEEISNMLIKQCYEECQKYIEMLSQEVVEKFIIPKIDFNSINNSIIRSIQEAPFVNELMIMDLVKDGQVDKEQIENYFELKENFRQYISMRIIFFDAANLYEPIKDKLCNEIKLQLEKYRGK